ncbi:hypothetical protein [Streptomyces aidingensis]|uniref:Uncharacterized protein n=1 Tax=Streptomyces aidingensis TaxID=910347 RepID=A0A1I1QW58_9ACTN|nr:hypothetical protein [Streptomyces aidingensis]SFD26351.1 hypothetical protein SAMN05421773_11242 [Streptomyces aidingensis]
MDSLALAVGTALVGAMASDAWQQARTATVGWWRRGRPERAEEVAADLDTDRRRVLAAHECGDQGTHRDVADAWRHRLQQFLDGDPEAAAGLRALLEEHLRPAAEAAEPRQTAGSVVLRAEARDQARVYLAGRDQHFTDS